MDNHRNFTEHIQQDKRSWSELQQTILRNGVLPDLGTIAGIMLEVDEELMTASEACDNTLLEAFLEGSSALRAVLRGVEETVLNALEPHPDGGHNRSHLKNIINSSEELKMRTQNLLWAVQKIQRRAKGLNTLGTACCLSVLGAVFRSDNNQILRNMAEQVKNAQVSFQTRNSVDIQECIDAVANILMRRVQFHMAEKCAQFIGNIISGAGSYHSVDTVRYHSEDAAQRSPTVHEQEDIAKDIDLWLSGDKRVYFLCEGHGIGRSPAVVDLCARSSSKRLLTAQLGGSFFFVFGNEYLASTRLALSSILYQLLPSELHTKTLERLHKLFSGGDRTRLRNVAEQLLRKAIMAATRTADAPILLVIDAIDRATEIDEIPPLLRCLLAYAREFSLLRLFVSGRPRPCIMSVLAHPSHADLVHRRTLGCDLRYWNDDCKQYLRYTLPKISACADLIYHRPAILKLLIRHIDDDFAFAHIAIKYLDMNHIDPEVVFTDVMRLFAMPPGQSRLDALFGRQLRFAFSQSPASRHESLYTLLRFVAYSGPTRLTPETIASYASHVSADDIVSAVDHLRAVLAINRKSEILPLDSSLPMFLHNKQPLQSRNDYYGMDRAVHFASISFTALLKANPVTRILQSALPTALLPDADVDAYRYPSPFLALWPKYLAGVKVGRRGQPSIADHLRAFVPSIQLAMYAWMTEPVDALRAASVVTRFITRQNLAEDCLPEVAHSRERTVSHFYAFISYVHLRREDRFRDPSAADVVEAVMKGCQDNVASCDIEHLDHANLTFTFDLRGKDHCYKVTADHESLATYNKIVLEFMEQLHGNTSAEDEFRTPGLLEGTFRMASWT